ncbi:C25 family cysteine peptidase [Niabella hibiscisoli]|uniref:C25 family cysteine peptidase n=1 Tax=Niabella hibiscisoli TaxID=1825928 RepID=UPI001F0E1934|nr:C25 family cysteine peptidase [Niabella hibiscisoli]MCH5715073.1 C25 family cysteine peptidase [Niabella hibiscisoli]
MKLPGVAGGKYLEIAGFSNSGTPVLYDLGTGRRYEADASNPALIKVYLQPTVANAEIVIANTATANIRTISNFETRNFVDYSATANQGDYLMITHRAILNGSGGAQPVEAYRAYRSSMAGGSYNAKIYLIDQLTDQFAYGIKGSPLSVRNFLRMARSKYATKIKNTFIIGRGVKYTSARYNESNAIMERLHMIPTFGEPASDVLLAAEGSSSVPLTPIGRVSVISGDELTTYLDKVKQYEQELTPVAGVNASSWKKNIIHMVGANDQGLIGQLSGYLNAHEAIIRDTLHGAQVTDFVKSSIPGSEQTATERLKNLMNSGVNLLTYFGHSAATTLAYNLEDPANYSNFGKYPVFHMMGCNVGDIFIFDQSRISAINTISERYLFAKERGSVGMMAGTSFGYVSNLGQYNGELYKLLARTGYGLTLGELMQKTITNYFAASGGSQIFLTGRKLKSIR